MEPSKNDAGNNSGPGNKKDTSNKNPDLVSGIISLMEKNKKHGKVSVPSKKEMQPEKDGPFELSRNLDEAVKKYMNWPANMSPKVVSGEGYLVCFDPEKLHSFSYAEQPIILCSCPQNVDPPQPFKTPEVMPSKKNLVWPSNDIPPPPPPGRPSKENRIHNEKHEFKYPEVLPSKEKLEWPVFKKIDIPPPPPGKPSKKDLAYNEKMKKQMEEEWNARKQNKKQERVKESDTAEMNVEGPRTPELPVATSDSRKRTHESFVEKENEHETEEKSDTVKLKMVVITHHMKEIDRKVDLKMELDNEKRSLAKSTFFKAWFNENLKTQCNGKQFEEVGKYDGKNLIEMKSKYFKTTASRLSHEMTIESFTRQEWEDVKVFVRSGFERFIITATVINNKTSRQTKRSHQSAKRGRYSDDRH